MRLDLYKPNKTPIVRYVYINRRRGGKKSSEEGKNRIDICAAGHPSLWLPPFIIKETKIAAEDQIKEVGGEPRVSDTDESEEALVEELMKLKPIDRRSAMRRLIAEKRSQEQEVAVLSASASTGEGTGKIDPRNFSRSLSCEDRSRAPFFINQSFLILHLHFSPSVSSQPFSGK